jgi:hypothetical protein
MVRHLDMQKIQLIGFFFENRLYWQFEVATKNLPTAVLGYLFIYIQITHLCIMPYTYLKLGIKI